MSDDEAPNAADDIQFDRVETKPSSGSSTAQPGVTCGSCRRAIHTQYFSIRETPLCEPCKVAFEASQVASRSWGTFGRAVLFGGGATIAGAVMYYAVLAITKLEIGLVAIAIGYMVGYAVRRGSRGWGGLRYQILALSLTYYSVGLAYFPLVVQDTQKPRPAAVSAPADSGAAAPQAAPPRPVLTLRGWLAAVSLVLIFCAALPVLAVIGSFPGGLISGAIIGFGMLQAWRMTAGPIVDVFGPYQVGTEGVSA